ncbi:MAG TPA: tyrosinase family protein [Vicinamibacterales bacterium]
MTFTRKNVWTLLSRDPWDDSTEDYARAVATMQARPADDPTSWTFQAAIHGSYSTPPAGAAWNECQHAGWFFLPWHRMYLYFFERIVRAAVIENGGDPEWALPYWNYDQPTPRNTLPKPLRTPTLPSGDPNALFLAAPQRDPAFVNGGRLPRSVTSPAAAMRERRFVPGFGGPASAPSGFNGGFGALEQTPHNVVHVQLGGESDPPCQGGLMIDPSCAALDPVFWLHHCNIDRLWKRWLDQGGGRANPTDVAWLSQSFTFHDETGAAVQLTCADVLDTVAQLEYGYDDDPFQVGVPMPAPAPPPTPPGGPPEMVAASDRPVELTGNRVSVSLSVAPDALPRLRGDAIGGAPGLAVGGDDTSIYLNVEDIDAPRNPGIVYGVYVNAPPGASADEREEYHVGNVSLFGIESVRDPNRVHSVPGLRHSFNISHVVDRLKAERRWNPATIDVTFEPIAPVGGAVPGAGGAPGIPQARTGSNIPVRIGRVSLFLG